MCKIEHFLCKKQQKSGQIIEKGVKKGQKRDFCIAKKNHNITIATFYSFLS